MLIKRAKRPAESELARPATISIKLTESQVSTILQQHKMLELNSSSEKEMETVKREREEAQGKLVAIEEEKARKEEEREKKRREANEKVEKAFAASMAVPLWMWER